MPSGYPGAIDSFTDKIDLVDTVEADDINILYDAVEKIETELGIDPAGASVDVVTRLGLLLAKAGGTMTGPIAMGGSKITGAGAATANGDLLRYEQLVGLYLALAGGTMAGTLDLNGQDVTNGGRLVDIFDKVSYSATLGTATPTYDWSSFAVYSSALATTVTSSTFTWPTMATSEIYTVELILQFGGAYTHAWPGEVVWVSAGGTPAPASGEYWRFYFQRLHNNAAWRTWGSGEKVA